jgi:rhomboid family GlyGly-CTERM serine protease
MTVLRSQSPGGYWLISILFGVVLMLSALQPLASDWLAFDRAALDGGQVWRIMTAHLVHLSITHTLGNTGGLALLAFIVRCDVAEENLAWLFLWCALVVGSGLYLIAPDLQRYVGLSGVLHGVLLVAPFLTPAYGRVPSLLFAAVIVGKVLWEQTPFYNDQALMEVIGGRVETRAHLLGVVAGGIWLLAMALWRQFPKR